MHIQKRLLTELTPYAQNPRHNAKAVDSVAKSIQTFGFKQPIVVDKDHVIIVGHTRYLAAKQLALSHVPVLVAEDLTPAQAKAYRLADNRTHENAEWNRDLLAIELGDLKALDIDLSLTGFSQAEIKGFMAMGDSVEQRETKVSEDAQDIPAMASLGDVWQLGRHRVMCGDSTKPTDIDLLMQGNRADLVFTDPPYNVNYAGCTPEQLTITGDHVSQAQFQHFLTQAFAMCVRAMKSTASLYVCHASSTQMTFQAALEANGFVIRNQLIWAKHHFVLSFGRYKFQHEPMFYCHLANARDAWYGDKAQTTLWSFDKPVANRLHPTMKPTALIEKALQNSSQAGDIVFDGFGGSGSTLLACDANDRTAYLMEIDPHYVDVILHRFQTQTGLSAKKCAE